MKKEIITSIILTIVCILFFTGIYPAIVWGIAQLAPNHGNGIIIKAGDGKVYYENIAESFTKDNYFWSRPSAVNYNANGSGGSNKGPDNPELLNLVQARIDTFLAHNPDVKKSDIPVDMVTASGSGLDPHISVQAALIQDSRIARARGLSKDVVDELVRIHIEKPFGIGPEYVNVLKLNIDLDKLNK